MDKLSLYYLAYPYAFVLGAIIGSFYTATASRVLYFFYGPERKKKHRLRSLLTRPSFCTTCKTPIRYIDLIPFAGYLMNRGRCRQCGAPIGLMTLIGEVVPAFLLPLLLYSGMGWPLSLSLILILGHLYIAMTTDYRFYQMDHENTAFLLPLAIASALVQSDWQWRTFGIYFVLPALCVFALLFLLRWITGGRMLGFADILVGSLITLAIGFPFALLFFQFAPLLAIVYFFLVIRERKTPIPFGVFLGIAYALTILVHAGYLIYMRDIAGL